MSSMMIQLRAKTPSTYSATSLTESSEKDFVVAQASLYFFNFIDFYWGLHFSLLPSSSTLSKGPQIYSQFIQDILSFSTSHVDKI